MARAINEILYRLVPYIRPVQDIGLGLTTIPEAGKVPPDTSTTGATDMALRLV
jgi:hypothetical protein